MINVNQITAQLARMPDQALQQYAQMHKNDPYVLSLALSESNRRKQMRQGAQVQAPEQPKVVDQAVASMAAPMPEDVGIAKLPTGEMSYADGGIVAFSDGGDVPRYQTGGVPMIQYGGPYGGAPMTGKTGYEGMGPMEFLSAAYEDIKKKIGPGLSPPERERAERTALAQANKLAAMQGSTFEDLYGAPTAPAPTDPRFRGARSDAATLAPPTPATAPATAQVTTPGAGPRRTPAAPAAPAASTTAAAPAAAAATTPGIPGLDVAAMTRQALEAAAKVPDPYAADRKALGEEKVKAEEEKVAGLEAINQKFADIYKGRRERLDTKEAELGKLKDQGLGLALLQAGAAMMTTPGGLGTAIGKGVKVGSEQYAAGLDKLRSAQEKLSDARDRLEEVEAQRGELSARELLKARSDVKQVGIGVREDLIKANMQMYNNNRDTAMKQVDNQIKVGLSQFEQQQQTLRTEKTIAGQLAAANAPSGQERMARALGGGDLEKGFVRMAEISAGKFDPRKAYSDYLVAAQKMPGTDLMSYSQFIAQLAIPTSPGNNSAAAPGTVRDRP